jgi:hypothetical protein
MHTRRGGSPGHLALIAPPPAHISPPILNARISPLLESPLLLIGFEEISARERTRLWLVRCIPVLSFVRRTPMAATQVAVTDIGVMGVLHACTEIVSDLSNIGT